ncbi:uncharacterized protein si:ch73-106k19.5 [Danio aesculapii]|uniref:uncharacterized protein si:ch73-106k19.5 n=1 Tax=Danio aesculapii TaxID=1142201 RepID=UPI0024C04C52|nr:uncharacterized protein si:ch73-106k19.5 [Danio aesculapii]
MSVMTQVQRSENDEEIYTKNLCKKPFKPGFTVSSDFAEIERSTTLKGKLTKQEISKKPSVHIGSVGVSASGVIGMADTIDRPAATTAEGVYVNTGAYALVVRDNQEKRLPKAGAYAEAGVGRARAEYSVFDAEAKGPNASAGAEASTALTAGAMARAEIGSVSANAGPVGVKLGLGVDTGASIGVDGLEVKVLGIGFSVGPRTSISFLGSEVSCSVM